MLRSSKEEHKAPLPKRVQKRAPSTGSGSEANRALNLPTMPSSSMKAAPYWITLRLPTCRENRTDTG